MKNILVTWWAWYIWSHTVLELEKAWYNTIIIDNLSNCNMGNIYWLEDILWKKLNFFEWDILDYDFLSNIFINNKIDLVVHFAWLKAVWESCEKVWYYQYNNISWSINLFKVMDENNVKNIIFSSSATVYKSKNIRELWWYNENDIVWDAANPYWTSKFIIEILLRDYYLHKWWKVINLRYFNPIWAHSSWKIWESPIWIPNNLLPYILKVAKWELKELWVFWNDYDTIDWTWVRDYIDVVDLSIWHLKSIEYLNSSNSSLFENFNLWVWNWYSVLQLHNICEKVIWKRIPYKILNRRPWDLDIVYSDPKKANEILSWKAEVDIFESVKNSWKFNIK